MLLLGHIDETDIADLSTSLLNRLQEKDSDIERLRDGLRRLTTTVDDQNEKMEFQESKLQELEEYIKELLEERDSHLQKISEQHEIIKSLKKDVLSNKEPLRIDDDAFELELKSRMKCSICLDHDIGRCCPVCVKGVCTKCYIRIRGAKLKMPCPHCRTESFDWKLVAIPRL